MPRKPKPKWPLYTAKSIVCFVTLYIYVTEWTHFHPAQTVYSNHQAVSQFDPNLTKGLEQANNSGLAVAYDWCGIFLVIALVLMWLPEIRKSLSELSKNPWNTTK